VDFLILLNQHLVFKMELFVKCIIIAIITAISATLLKRYLPEISIVILVIASALLLTSMSGVLGNVFEFLETLAAKAGISDQILSIMFKITAIGILSKIACDVCISSGAGTLATISELCASTVAIILSMPLFSEVIGLITRM